MRNLRGKSGFGWMELIIGILLIILGILSILRPSIVLTWVVIIYGIFALATGIEDIIFYVKMTQHTGFGPTISLITGVLSIMVGGMLLLHPESGTLIVAVLFPIWFIAHCIGRLSHLNVLKFAAGTFFYVFSMVVNILGLILGIMMIFLPGISLFSTGLIIGVYLILLGIDNIVIAVSSMGSDF